MLVSSASFAWVLKVGLKLFCESQFLNDIGLVAAPKRQPKFRGRVTHFAYNDSEVFEWRATFDNAEVNALHAECFEHRELAGDWWTQVNHFSLGWVSVRRSMKLIGFVNVAWDGGAHAFILDAMVDPASQRRGIAKAMIKEAVARAKRAGCEWLHVDFEPHLVPLYFEACGFKATNSGLVLLK